MIASWRPSHTAPLKEPHTPSTRMTYDLIAKGNLVLPTSDPTRRLTGLEAAALILGACADGVDEPTGPSDQDAFELPVHLHVVQSDHVGALNALLTDPEVGKLMVAVNQTWSQAGITWILESIVRERARNESVFREALMNRALSPIAALPSVLSHDDARPDVWNVFMIRDFGGRWVVLTFRGSTWSSPRRSIRSDSETCAGAWRGSSPTSWVTPSAWPTLRAPRKAT